MEYRTRRDATLRSLVSHFESSYEKGKVDFLREDTINQLLFYYEVDGQVEKALEVVNIALDQYKYRSDFYISKARLLLALKRVDQCMKVLDDAQNIAPYETDISILRARALAMSGMFSEAMALLHEIKGHALIGDMVDIHLCESHVHEMMKEYDDMYESLVEAVMIDSQNVDVLKRLWTSIDLGRRYEDSIELHNKLLDRNPYSHMAWYNLGHAYACVQEYDRAINAMEYSFIINTDFEAGYIDCAELCFSTGRYEQAISIYEEALDVFGINSDLLVSMSECLIILGRIDEAKDQLVTAIKYDTYSDEAYYHLAQCYYKTNDWYSSINAFYKAISLEDGTENYYLGLAKAFVEVEDYDKAIVNFQLAAQTAPEVYSYWHEYATFLLKMGRYQEALMVLDDAEEHTFSAELLYCRAMAHFFLKEKEQGLGFLEEALLEDFHLHPVIFEIAPEIEVNEEIQSMLQYFGGE